MNITGTTREMRRRRRKHRQPDTGEAATTESERRHMCHEIVQAIQDAGEAATAAERESTDIVGDTENIGVVGSIESTHVAGREAGISIEFVWRSYNHAV